MCSAIDGDVLSLFTNHPKFGDIAGLQSGAVRPLCGRIGRRQVEAAARSCDRPAVLRQSLAQPAVAAADNASTNGNLLRSADSATAIATTNSATCSPTSSIAAGIYRGESVSTKSASGCDHRRGPRPARNRAHL